MKSRWNVTINLVRELLIQHVGISTVSNFQYKYYTGGKIFYHKKCKKMMKKSGKIERGLKKKKK